MNWIMDSNDGLQRVRFDGEYFRDGLTGFLSLSANDYCQEGSTNEAESNIWQVTLNQFPFSRKEIGELQDGLKYWCDSSYKTGFVVHHSSHYYHQLSFHLKPTDPQTGKATFEIVGLSWSMKNLHFEMIVDQSCVLETITQIDVILNELEVRSKRPI